MTTNDRALIIVGLLFIFGLGVMLGYSRPKTQKEAECRGHLGQCSQLLQNCVISQTGNTVEGPPMQIPFGEQE